MRNCMSWLAAVINKLTFEKKASNKQRTYYQQIE